MVLSVIAIGYKTIPNAYANTNAAALATISANDTNISSATTSTEGLQIKKVTYFDNVSGYLVYPAAANTTGNNKLSAIIMIHNYAVLGIDLFKGKLTKDPKQAMQQVKSVTDMPGEAISNMQAAVKYLSSLPFVDSSKIVSMGWCFGGGQSLQLALHSEQHPLAATILYYGTPLVTDKQEVSKIKWPVLGIFGDKDQAIPLPEIQKFKAALDADGIPNEIHIYKGVGHAFANPSGANYAPKETADAWQKTLAFLKKYV